MADKPVPPQGKNPAEIARETFGRLASRRISPTPDAYRDIYNEIAGTAEPLSAEVVLSEFATEILGAPSRIAEFGHRFNRAIAARDWQDYRKNLSELIERHLMQVPGETAAGAVTAKPASPVVKPGAPIAANLVEDQQARLLRDLLVRTLSLALTALLEGRPELAAESEALAQSLKEAKTEAALNEIGVRLKQLCFKIESSAASSNAATGKIAAPVRAGKTVVAVNAPDQQAQQLRELLTRTLTLAVGSLLQGAPELAEESETLARSIKDAHSEVALNEVSVRLKQLCFKIELKSGDMAEEHELLMRLFKLLLENISELLDDDSWLSGQIAGVQNLLSGPISHHGLVDATRSLKDVIYKQGMLKHSLAEAKITVKNMMITFIDRLSALAETTGEYHGKIEKYSTKISQAQDINTLNAILDDVMRDTRITQTETLRSRDEMINARKEVQEAEARIHDLESKLEQMSELVREDQLTGSLNRRGLDDVFERELARSDRRHSPMCVAMLDLDDFKKLNDTHGHTAGDEALIHLVRVIKETLRTMDVIARFGGEEFLILLPDTPIDDAMMTITRLQRELTKQIFMHNNTRLLMTFSAGVALRAPNEDQISIIKRADEALYKAKRAGKNRVVAAE